MSRGFNRVSGAIWLLLLGLALGLSPTVSARAVRERVTVEHPNGTIKPWMGATHFKMRQLKNVATEMALHVLASNMARVINITGIPVMSAVMKA